MNNNSYIYTFLQNFNLKCSKTTIRDFKKNENITTYLVNRKQLCILISGNAELIRYDRNGDKHIVEQFNNNSIFGEIFYDINNNNELFVVAKEDCSVLFFDFNFYTEKCKTKCPFHDELLLTIPNLILSKITELNSHMELLEKKSIREKLILYFNNLSRKNLSQTFTLPFSLTDLADYLSVNRSAMMRQIKQLDDEKIIKKEGNKITLLTR